MQREAVGLACLGTLLLGFQTLSNVQVRESGFIVERVAALATDAVSTVEAVRQTAYGDGVMAGIIEGQFLTLTRYSSTGASELTRIGPFSPGSELVSLRFDTTDQFGNQLLLSVAHGVGLEPGNVVTDIYAIDGMGRARLLKSLGSRENPVILNLEICPQGRGYPPGLYLQDRDLVNGSPLYLLAPSLELSLIDRNLLPAPRSDIDVYGMRFDPTGLYSHQLFLADRDDHDELSGIYLLDERMRWAEFVRPEPIAKLAFGELAFSPGGALDLALYVIERVGDRVVRVSPTGRLDEFATGFSGVESITISEDGNTMYLSADNGIYSIRADATAR